MTNKKLLDLIQRDVDGVLTPEEQSLLREELAQNSEGAAMHKGLQSLSRTLEAVEPRDVPQSLKPAIMRAVEARATAPKKRAAAISEPVWAFFRSLSPRGAFVGGLIVGLGVALIAVTVMMPLSFEETDLIGTALLAESIPLMTPAARVPVAADGVSGSLVMESSGKFQVATILLSSNSTTHSAIITYPATMVRLDAVRPADPASVPVTAGAGRIELQGRGTTRLELLFTVIEASPEPLRLTIRNADGVEQQTAIAFAPTAPR